MESPRLAALFVAFFCAGCVQRLEKKLVEPAMSATLDHEAPFLKAHLRDGGVYILAPWRIDELERVVVGEGELQDAERQTVKRGSFRVPIAEVALFETNVLHTSPAVAALAVISVASAGLTLYCATHSKSCFGSCPTFYASNGERELLLAEGFSDSVAPSLEATDLDALYRARPSSRDFELRMKNEALETHVVKRAALVLAERPEGGRVFATQEGELWQATQVQAPRSCSVAEGDCLRAVSAMDGRERSSATDATDLAAREIVELEFDAAPPRAGLVIGARQTFLSTYLFYQALAYLGRRAGDFIMRLEREEPGTLERVRGIRHALGGIEVLIWKPDGTWSKAGEVHETGPLAADVKIVPLPESGPGPVRVRLRLTRGHWRLDFLALASIGERAAPISLQPAAVRGLAAGASATFAPTPARPMLTLPGDEVIFTYRLPEGPERYELFLESRGYYLEWMRKEWLAEESMLRAAALFLDPEDTLRRLAPQFKAEEARLDDLFWKSRYVPR